MSRVQVSVVGTGAPTPEPMKPPKRTVADVPVGEPFAAIDEVLVKLVDGRVLLLGLLDSASPDRKAMHAPLVGKLYKAVEPHHEAHAVVSCPHVAEPRPFMLGWVVSAQTFKLAPKPAPEPVGVLLADVPVGQLFRYARPDWRTLYLRTDTGAVILCDRERTGNPCAGDTRDAYMFSGDRLVVEPGVVQVALSGGSVAPAPVGFGDVVEVAGKRGRVVKTYPDRSFMFRAFGSREDYTAPVGHEPGRPMPAFILVERFDASKLFVGDLVASVEDGSVGVFNHQLHAGDRALVTEVEPDGGIVLDFGAALPGWKQYGEPKDVELVRA